MMFIKILIFSVLLIPLDSIQLPPGYFAFKRATRIDGVPPRVRKPPYVPANVPCPGAIKSDQRFSPKDTLCGDLNRGYVPLNPMRQDINGQPHPFELIKNKTLRFLAKSLPFLKQDINNIPKVAKLPLIHSPLSFKAFNQHHANHFLKKRSLNKTTSKIHLFKEPKIYNGFNFTEARQKVCEQNEGMLCQVMQVFSGSSKDGQSSLGSGMLNTLSQAVQMVTAASNAATTAQNIGSFASLIQTIATGSGSNSDSNNKSSMISQLINALASLNSGSASAASSSNFSPISAIVEYLMANGASPISSLLPARRKKPMDLEEIASEAISVSHIPPTPCPSIEEYVAPVYARNYQGVWKYVVQIPHEGYFTQTVQKITCVKNRCDFIDGACHESSRWVSLLVAEIFYPQPKYPYLVASKNDFKPSASTTNTNSYMSNHLNPLNSMKSINHNDYNDFDKYTNRKISYRHQEESTNTKKAGNTNNNSKAKPRNIEDEGKKDNECDGYDNIGCYVIRVYYDWFLVPGACKCWKKNTHGGLDSFKKLFIGK